MPPFLDDELALGAAAHQDDPLLGNVLAPACALSPSSHRTRPSPDALLWQRHTSEPTRVGAASFRFIYASVSTTPGIARIQSSSLLHLIFFLTSSLISAHARSLSLSYSYRTPFFCFFYGFVRVPVDAGLGARSRLTGSRVAMVRFLTAAWYLYRSYPTSDDPDFPPPL
jgi:hypothetical protein